MTELYQPRAGETAEPADDPARDTGEHGDQARYETTSGGDHGDAGTRTTLADQDQLPTRQDARAATWGQDPEYDDENDPDTGYDADPGALTAAEEDRLPTRQDARAATWGQDPDYYDENDPGEQYDGDPGALTADGHALDTDQDDPDQAAAGQDTPATTEPDAPPAEAPDSMAASPADQEERSPASTSERITELEAENAQQAKSITDLEARLERLEQGSQERPAAGIPDRARDVDDLPGETTEREHGRRLPSDARLALGGTVAGIALTTAAEHMPTGPGHMMEYLGGALSVGISAIAVWRENRKKDVHRPEN